MNKYWKGLYRLLDRYQDGTINPIKKQVVDFWYDSLGSNENESGLDLIKDPQLKSEMWDSIKEGMYGNQTLPETVFVKKWWHSVYFKFAAASLILVIGFLAYQANVNKYSIIANVPDAVIKDLTHYTNSEQKAKLIVLSDGSQVTLEPSSTLYYPQVFKGNDRKVFLKGNGFFEIKPDKNKPFLVFADHIVTRVVGTSFNIRKKDQGRIEVAVVTGIVKVQNNSSDVSGVSKNEEVTITRNKKVTFSPESKTMLIGLVEQPVISHHKDSADMKLESFNYQDEPMSRIISQFERAYGVKIILGNANLKNCSITADVSNFKDLFAQLDILCAAIGASYELKEDTVVLTGTGCELRN